MSNTGKPIRYIVLIEREGGLHPYAMGSFTEDEKKQAIAFFERASAYWTSFLCEVIRGPKV